MATGTFLQKSLLNHERLFFPMAEGGGIGPGPPLDVFTSIKKNKLTGSFWQWLGQKHPAGTRQGQPGA